MAAGNSTIFFSASGSSITGSPSGTEPGNSASRRILPLLDAQYARTSFVMGAAGTQVRVEFSTDGGTNWNMLVPNSQASVAGQIVVTDWAEFPAAARTDTTMIRVMVVNANVAVTVFLVCIQWR